MSLRLRLTLLTTALVGLTLATLGSGLYYAMQQGQYERVNGDLREYTSLVLNDLNQRRFLQIFIINPLQIASDEKLDTGQLYGQVFAYNEQLLMQSPNLAASKPMPHDPATFATARAGTPTLTSATIFGKPMQVLYTPVIDKGRVSLVVQAATSLVPLNTTLSQLRLVLLAVGVLALALVGFGTWWTTGRALGAVARVAATAQIIEGSQDLSQRIPLPGGVRDDEMSRLIRTFNSMLARLDAAFQAQHQFVADSSHELRSPLTVIRGNLELWRRARSDEEREAAVSAIEQETGRMTRLVENLLFLAQVEGERRAAAPRIGQELVELDSLLLMVYGQARVLGREHHIVLGHEDAVQVRGSQDQLQQLLLNLVDNAIKYTPAGGTIRLALYGEGPWARLEVADTGIGIAADDLPNIFDRFYRSDKARSRTLGGAGLGLAIVREVAEAHGGRVEVESTPGVGTLFRVYLPRLTARDLPALPAPPTAVPLPLPTRPVALRGDEVRRVG